MSYINKPKIVAICDKLIEACFCALLVSVTFSISFTEVFSSLLVLAWLVKVTLTREFGFLRNTSVVLLMAYFLWNVISLFRTTYLDESVRGIFKVAEYGLIFIAAFHCLKPDRVAKKAVFFMTAATVLVCVDGLIQHSFGTDILRHHTLIPQDYMRRISASFVHPNDFGVYLVVVSVVLAAMTLSGNIPRIGRFIFGGAACLALLSLFLTQSRGAWLSFIAAFLIFGILNSRKAIAVFLVVLGVVFVALPYTTQERIFNLADTKNGTTWERLMLWKGTINMIKERPIMGFGPNTYSRNFPKYRPVNYPDERYAHNSYLQIASESGIPGAFLFLTFIMSVFVVSFRRISLMSRGALRDLTGALLAGLAGFALNSLVDTHLQSVTLSVFFFMLLGAMCSFAGGENGGK